MIKYFDILNKGFIKDYDDFEQRTLKISHLVAQNNRKLSAPELFQKTIEVCSNELSNFLIIPTTKSFGLDYVAPSPCELKSFEEKFVWVIFIGSIFLKLSQVVAKDIFKDENVKNRYKDNLEEIDEILVRFMEGLGNHFLLYVIPESLRDEISHELHLIINKEENEQDV